MTMDGQDAGAVSDWRLGRQVHERLLHVTGTFTYTTVPPCISPFVSRSSISLWTCVWWARTLSWQDSGLLQQGSDISGALYTKVTGAQWALLVLPTENTLIGSLS